MDKYKNPLSNKIDSLRVILVGVGIIIAVIAAFLTLQVSMLFIPTILGFALSIVILNFILHAISEALERLYQQQLLLEKISKSLEDNKDAHMD